jgi:hypothetical protein
MVHRAGEYVAAVLAVGPKAAAVLRLLVMSLFGLVLPPAMPATATAVPATAVPAASALALSLPCAIRRLGALPIGCIS